MQEGIEREPVVLEMQRRRTKKAASRASTETGVEAPAQAWAGGGDASEGAEALTDHPFQRHVAIVAECEQRASKLLSEWPIVQASIGKEMPMWPRSRQENGSRRRRRTRSSSSSGSSECKESARKNILEKAEHYLSKHSESWRRFRQQLEDEKATTKYERQGRIIADALKSNFETMVQQSGFYAQPPHGPQALPGGQAAAAAAATGQGSGASSIGFPPTPPSCSPTPVVSSESEASPAKPPKPPASEREEARRASGPGQAKTTLSKLQMQYVHALF